MAVGVVATALIAFYTYLRRLRVQGKSSKYVPTKFLKEKWNNWQPVGKYAYVNSSERGENRRPTITNTNASTSYHGREETAAVNAAAAGIDRNTSVRSVMTLPAYSQAPKDTEQVIGREGERAGMDTVVEFPETQEEEDAIRDAEMESLYQIRQARRREIAEREERRQERRLARERGDWNRLEELRRESRARNQASNQSTGNLTADVLIAEHQSRPKERRVSSVAYMDVGQVRHDGTRLRANSTESERGGLLDGAAPMGENTHGRTGSSATSLFTLNDQSSHSLARPNLPFAGGRQRSDSGALSISTMSSFDIPQPTPSGTDEPNHNHTSDESGPHSTSTESPTASRLTPEGTEPDDSNVHGIPRPPDYEHLDWGDAPSYEEALRRRESQRSARLAVPTINIQSASEPNSPALGRVSEDTTR